MIQPLIELSKSDVFLNLVNKKVVADGNPLTQYGRDMKSLELMASITNILDGEFSDNYVVEDYEIRAYNDRYVLILLYLPKDSNEFKASDLLKLKLDIGINDKSLFSLRNETLSNPNKKGHKVAEVIKETVQFNDFINYKRKESGIANILDVKVGKLVESTIKNLTSIIDEKYTDLSEKITDIEVFFENTYLKVNLRSIKAGFDRVVILYSEPYTFPEYPDGFTVESDIHDVKEVYEDVFEIDNDFESFIVDKFRTISSRNYKVIQELREVYINEIRSIIRSIAEEAPVIKCDYQYDNNGFFEMTIKNENCEGVTLEHDIYYTNENDPDDLSFNIDLLKNTVTLKTHPVIYVDAEVSPDVKNFIISSTAFLPKTYNIDYIAGYLRNNGVHINPEIVSSGFNSYYVVKIIDVRGKDIDVKTPLKWGVQVRYSTYEEALNDGILFVLKTYFDATKL